MAIHAYSNCIQMQFVSECFGCWRTNHQNHRICNALQEVLWQSSDLYRQRAARPVHKVGSRASFHQAGQLPTWLVNPRLHNLPKRNSKYFLQRDTAKPSREKSLPDQQKLLDDRYLVLLLEIANEIPLGLRGEPTSGQSQDIASLHGR